jgi:feruloyl-CoA synthase
LRFVLESANFFITRIDSKVKNALVLSEPPSIDSGEVTDKGSINQRAVLKQRHAWVQAMHAGTANGLLTPAPL